MNFSANFILSSVIIGLTQSQVIETSFAREKSRVCIYGQRLSAEREFQKRELIEFLARIGYRDEPQVGEDGKPLLRRTTPLHRAARRVKHLAMPIRELFKIFNHYDANHVDEVGLTHFHIACRYGCADVVEKFLDLGRVDPNACPVPGTGNSPLHLALKHEGHFKVAALLLSRGADPNSINLEGSSPLHFVSQHNFGDWPDKYFRIVDELNLSVPVNARDKLGRTPLYLALQYGSKKEVESLLRRGADPNLADSRGFTPAHKFCASSVESYRAALMKLFFELAAELNRPVEVDALDELGRTPLHYAVADLYPQVVDVLLDHGADVSNFVFPTEPDFDLFHKMGYELKYESKYNLVSRAVSVINMLEKRGRELYRSEALIVMKFFAKCGLFEKSAHLEANNWYKDEELFASKAKEVMLKTDLSLYDLMRLPAREAEKLCTKTNYFEFIMLGSVTRGWEQWCRLPAATSEACLMHLCDKMSRRFFRDWALDPFYELIHKRLPILCCEMIVDNLMNEDLCNICLAVWIEARNER